MDVSMDEFRLMAQRAGLAMEREELDELKPIYDLYAAYAAQLHTLNQGAEEMAVEFHPTGRSRGCRRIRRMAARRGCAGFFLIRGG